MTPRTGPHWDEAVLAIFIGVLIAVAILLWAIL